MVILGFKWIFDLYLVALFRMQVRENIVDLLKRRLKRKGA